MPPRSKTIDPRSPQVVHVSTRCSRRSHLCGYDTLLKVDYEHRREWIRRRIEFLAGIYCIDVITYSVLHNNHHELLRSRPDVVDTLSDEEVVRRWLKLDKGRYFSADGRDRKSTKDTVAEWLRDPKKIKQTRRSLSDISKFMQSLNQHIAIKANAEEAIEGKFFEQRYRHEVLVDSTDILGCSLFIDLNPISAEVANSPDESEYTGAYERISDLRIFLAVQDGENRLCLSQSTSDVHQWERLGENNSGWLCPIEFDNQLSPKDPDVSSTGKRASDKGVFSMSLEEYIELLSETGIRIHAEKMLQLPDRLHSLLARLRVGFEMLVVSIKKRVTRYSKYFRATEREGRPDFIDPLLPSAVMPHPQPT